METCQPGVYSFQMPISFASHAARLLDHIARTHGIRVVTRDIPEPLTGDLNGEQIDIDHAVTAEQKLFLLGHLFGHIVQWNTDPNAFDIGQQFKPPVDEKLFPAVVAYEGEAGSYGLAVMHEIGISDADQWFSNYIAADQRYLLHFYRTGDRGVFHEFWRDDATLVEPKPIPTFVPIKRVFRMDGIVV